MTTLTIHSRMNEAWLNDPLRNAMSTKKFIKLLQDYMSHVRALEGSMSATSEEEVESAQKFVRWVNNDLFWRTIQQYVTEFQSPPKDISSAQTPLQYILKSVARRLPPSTAQPTETEANLTAVEVFRWERTAKRIQYIAQGSIEVPDSGAQVRDDVDHVIDHLKATSDRMRPAHDLIHLLRTFLFRPKGRLKVSGHRRAQVDRVITVMEKTIHKRAEAASEVVDEDEMDLAD